MEMERRLWILIFLIFRERNEGMKLVRFSIGSVGGEARSLINLVARRVGGGVEWPSRRETRSETTRSREERRGCRRARLRET